MKIIILYISNNVNHIYQIYFRIIFHYWIKIEGFVMKITSYIIIILLLTVSMFPLYIVEKDLKTDHLKSDPENADNTFEEKADPSFLNPAARSRAANFHEGMGGSWFDDFGGDGIAEPGFVVSPVINLPSDHRWSLLSLLKIESEETSILLSVRNATNDTIPGFGALKDRNIDITNITEESILLVAELVGNGSISPVLKSWGVEYVSNTSWMDSFTGDSGLIYPYASDIHIMGQWSFIEGMGNSTSDLSWNENNGRLYNMNHTSWVRGWTDNGLWFDGFDDYAVCGPNIDLVDDFTIEAFVFIPDNGSGNQSIVSQGGDGWCLGFNKSSDKFELWGPNNETIVSSPDPYDKGWHYVAAVKEDITYRLFIDGSEVDSINTVVDLQSHGNVYLGGMGPDNGGYFEGIIDDVRLSSIPRRSMEIFMAYDNHINVTGGSVSISETDFKPDSSCVGYWKLSERKGGLARDYSSESGFAHLKNTEDTVHVNGVRDSALHLDGVDDHAVCNQLADYDTGALTIEAWVKWENRTECVIVSKEDEFYFERQNSGGGNTFHMRIKLGGSWYGGMLEYMWMPAVDQWYHLASVWNGTHVRCYIDGQEVSTENAPGVLTTTANPVYLGCDPQETALLNGSMDEILIFNRALSDADISDHYELFSQRLYHDNTTFISEPVVLPENMTWNSLVCHREFPLPQLIYANITLLDGNTGEMILNDTSRSAEVIQDLSSVNPLDHSSLVIIGEMVSYNDKNPEILDWGINWTPIMPPAITSEINDVQVLEETPVEGLIDLADHFLNQYAQFGNLSFSLENISDNSNATISLNGSFLDITYLAENFTGNISVVVNCTNYFNRTASSNPFNIIIMDLPDAPVWIGMPPSIGLLEGSAISVNWSLMDYIFDSENSTLNFTIIPGNENITAELIDNYSIKVSAEGDWYGVTVLNISAYETSNPVIRSGNLTVPVIVNDFNSPPFSFLITPQDGSLIEGDEVTLNWFVIDADNLPEDIRCDLYLGESLPLEKFSSNITGFNVTISGLDIGVEYKWKIIPRDLDSIGWCEVPYWTFTLNGSADPSEALLLYPVNGSAVDMLNVTLSWFSLPAANTTHVYRIFVGTSLDSLNLIETVYETFYNLTGLVDNTTYYWKVVPVADGVTGICISGTWNFKIEMPMPEPDILEFQLDRKAADIELGSEVTIYLTIMNIGDINRQVTLTKGGSTFVYVDAPKNTTVGAGSNITVPLVFSVSENAALDVYNVSLKAAYPGGQRFFYFSINSIRPIDEDGEDSSGNRDMLLYIIIGLIVMVILAVVIFIVIRLRKKDPADDAIDDSMDDMGTDKEPEIQKSSTSDLYGDTMFIGETEDKNDSPPSAASEYNNEDIAYFDDIVPQPADYEQDDSSKMVLKLGSDSYPDNMADLNEPAEENNEQADVSAGPENIEPFGEPSFDSEVPSSPEVRPAEILDIPELPAAQGMGEDEGELPPPPDEPPAAAPDLPASGVLLSTAEYSPSVPNISLPDMASAVPPPQDRPALPEAPPEIPEQGKIARIQLLEAEIPKKCRICFGRMSAGDSYSECKCGFTSHKDCVMRAGRCPGCGGMVTLASFEEYNEVSEPINDEEETPENEPATPRHKPPYDLDSVFGDL